MFVGKVVRIRGSVKNGENFKPSEMRVLTGSARGECALSLSITDPAEDLYFPVELRNVKSESQR